jgi:hypothetical protein
MKENVHKIKKGDLELRKWIDDGMANGGNIERNSNI